jgi:hypothetical protein
MDQNFALMGDRSTYQTEKRAEDAQEKRFPKLEKVFPEEVNVSV